MKFETEIRIMNEINLNDIEDGLFTAIMREMKTCVHYMTPRIMTPDFFQPFPLKGEKRHINLDSMKIVLKDKLEEIYHKLKLRPEHWVEMMASYARSYASSILPASHFGNFPEGMLKDKKDFFIYYFQRAWEREFMRFGSSGQKFTVREFQEKLANSKVCRNFDENSGSWWRLADLAVIGEPKFKEFDKFPGYFLGNLIAEHPLFFKTRTRNFKKMAELFKENLHWIKFRKENCQEAMKDYITAVRALHHENISPETAYKELVRGDIVMYEGESNFSPYTIHGVINAYAMMKYVNEFVPGIFSKTPHEFSELVLEKIPDAKRVYLAKKNEKESSYKSLREENRKLLRGKKEIRTNLY